MSEENINEEQVNETTSQATENENNAADTLMGTLSTRSSLKIVETVKYKRFLGFLWKTNKVKSRKVDVVSLNPNETIEDIDFVIIEE